MMMNPAYREKPDDGYDEDAAEDVVEEDEDAAKKESESEDGSVPSLETDLSSDDDQINIPGIEGRSSSLRDHVDYEDQDCPQPFDELVHLISLVSGILLDVMEPSYISFSIQPERRY